ncbi:MAG: hypothetical protein LBB05_01645 [Puniceicoccales bacterium]|jgi:hypothetical protein|nr:hypothetical protein [Puniceicoccales bacterium]
MGGNLIKLVICGVVSGSFQDLLATQGPDSTHEEEGGIYSSSDEEDEDAKNLIVINSESVKQALQEKFCMERKRDSEKVDALISPFIENLCKILRLDMAEKVKFFAIQQTMLHAIENDDSLRIAQILNDEIGRSIYEKISKHGIGALTEAEKENNVTTLENECYTTIGRFFNERQVLWIEYAIEKGSLDAVALFIIYHWHSTYSDDEEKTNKKLNDLVLLAFQCEQFKIETLLRRLFDTECSEEVSIQEIRKDLKKYPAYGKDKSKVVKRNIQFMMRMTSTLTDDPARYYIQ